MTPQYTNNPNMNPFNLGMYPPNSGNLINNNYRQMHPRMPMFDAFSNANHMPNFNNFGQPLTSNAAPRVSASTENELLTRLANATNPRDREFYKNQIRITNPQLYQQLVLNNLLNSNLMTRVTNVNPQTANMRVNPVASSTPRPIAPNTNISRQIPPNLNPQMNRLPIQVLPNANVQTDASRQRPQNN